MSTDERTSKPTGYAALPEAQLFDSPEEAKEFIARTARADYRSGKILLAGLFYAFVFVSLPLIALELVREWVDWPGGYAWWKRGIVVAGMVASTAFCLRGYRRGMQDRMRTELGRRGVPTCTACHYCLRGIDSDRCPECGAPVKSAGSQGW